MWQVLVKRVEGADGADLFAWAFAVGIFMLLFPLVIGEVITMVMGC